MIRLAELNEIELVYRSRPEIPNRCVQSSADAYQILKLFYGDQLETREMAVLLALDAAGIPKAVYKLSCGGVVGTTVDPKLVFCAALKTLACAIVISHNHPSGHLVPSAKDKALTARLVECGKLLDIVVFDHLIMGAEGFFSFADAGLL